MLTANVLCSVSRHNAAFVHGDSIDAREGTMVRSACFNMLEESSFAVALRRDLIQVNSTMTMLVPI